MRTGLRVVAKPVPLPVPRPLGMVRASADRWAKVSALCKQLRRLVKANVQMDLLPVRGNWKERLDAAAGVDDAIEAVSEMIDEEVSRVSCEQLQAELARRRRKEGR